MVPQVLVSTRKEKLASKDISVREFKLELPADAKDADETDSDNGLGAPVVTYLTFTDADFDEINPGECKDKRRFRVKVKVDGNLSLDALLDCIHCVDGVSIWSGRLRASLPL